MKRTYHLREPSAIGRQLLRLREEQGYTQEQLAERTELSVDLIKKLEQGVHQDTRTATLTKLAEALGTDLHSLTATSSPGTSQAAAPTANTGDTISQAHQATDPPDTHTPPTDPTDPDKDTSPWRKFGAILSGHRKKIGMSQRQAAEAIHVHYSTLAKWESGGHRPDITSIKDFDRLCNADGHLVQLYAAYADIDRLKRGTLRPNLPNRDEEDEMYRRAAMQLLAGLGFSTIVPPAALETIMARAERAIGDHPTLNLDDWDWTIYEHVDRYIAEAPGTTLAELAADFIEVGHLLSHARSDVTRTGLSRVGAQLAGLMAMDFSDIGQTHAARRSFTTARRLADASGDQDVRVWVRAQEAQKGLYTGRPAPVVLRLTSDAIGVADGRVSAGLALAHGTRAVVLAAQGTRTDALAAIDRLTHVHEQRPTGNDPSAWPWQGGQLGRAKAYVYALLGDRRASTAADRALSGYASTAYGPIANARLVQALGMVRERHIDDGLALAAQTAATIPPSSTRRVLAGQILDALPRQAHELDTAQQLRALTASTPRPAEPPH